MGRNSYGFLSFTVGAIFMALISFAVLNSLQMPVGNFVDWLIGIAIFAWLMTVVTVPWNIHFEAREVLNDAEISRKKQIEFDESQLSYVRKLHRYALFAAIFLHLISALGLYWLSWAQISVVGYYGSGAALLLTFLRPSIRAYEYISTRLYYIRQEIKFPREDMHTLRIQLDGLQMKVEDLEKMLNPNEEESWLSRQEAKTKEHKHQISHLEQNLTELKAENEKEHEKIMKETRHAVAQLSEDGKFIDNLVEIIRFIKKV
ncbi:MAG: hypothetical protein NW226_15635 [Microscillaceae bacterium]|nr:hypothetical protein [Microscillaceae bacterium]